MIRVWGRGTSSNVQKVLWLCEELSLRYERIDAGGPFGRLDEPAYRAMNPNGLVPTIEDGDFVLWESNSILRYLAQREAAHDWYPSALRERAIVEQWMDWANTVFAPAMFPAFWQLVRTPAAQRDAAAVDASVRRTGEALAMVEDRLRAHPYLCGSTPTLADVAIGVNMHRWFNLPIDRPQQPALHAWYERLAARAPYRDLVMIPIR